MRKKIVVAIDGPAGAGKSTIARLVAGKLGYIYIDTGAMYRSVTWKFLQSGRAFDADFISKLSDEMTIKFYAEKESNRVFVDDFEVTDAIRSAEVTGMVSKVAAIGAVREAMVKQQRRMGAGGGVLMDGRDIGTVVFPDAQLKIFLTATVEERAARRYKELAAKGQKIDLRQLQQEIAERDKQDSERLIGPLKQACDAVLLDSSSMTIDQVCDFIIKLVRERENVLCNC
ncbi:MAG: (d)CMP kinase [Acidaminococcaceae bacterium]|nr:(d)CMP kinase [Acidaminococcaceae bacterium]